MLIDPAVGVKHDKDKPEWHMLPLKEVEEIVRVLGFGKKKYDEDNWKNGIRYSRLWDATMRHLVAWNQREDLASDSGISHLAHAATNLLFLMWYQNNLGKEWDDRPNPTVEPKPSS